MLFEQSYIQVKHKNNTKLKILITTGTILILLIFSLLIIHFKQNSDEQKNTTNNNVPTYYYDTFSSNNNTVIYEFIMNHTQVIDSYQVQKDLYNSLLYIPENSIIILNIVNTLLTIGFNATDNNQLVEWINEITSQLNNISSPLRQTITFNDIITITFRYTTPTCFTTLCYNNTSLLPSSILLTNNSTSQCNIGYYGYNCSYYSLPFISIWNVVNDNDNQIILPLVSGGSYDAIIDWGDGTTSYTQSTHIYSNPGIYTIHIYGNIFRGFDFTSSSQSQKNAIIEISQFGILSLINNNNNDASYFHNCVNLIITATDTLNLTGITSMKNMFSNIGGIALSSGINNWDVSQITDMTSLFSGITTFNNPLGNWNTASVTSMSTMFGAHTICSFNDPGIIQWDVSSVTNMYNMFSGCVYFNQNISSWNVAQVTNFEGMFSTCSQFNQPIGNWNIQSATTLSSMFSFATSFNQPINNWNIASVTDLSYLFNQATSFNQPLHSWNIIINVVDIEGIFLYASAFNQDLSNWNIQNIYGIYNMFDYSALSIANYNAFLISIVNEGSLLHSNLIFGAAGIKYSCTPNVAANAHHYLTGTKQWEIIDNGCIQTYCIDNPTVCQNGATCSESSPYYYTCNCIEGYFGINCNETYCDNNPCQNGGICSISSSSSPSPFTCTCIGSYFGSTCTLSSSSLILYFGNADDNNQKIYYSISNNLNHVYPITINNNNQYITIDSLNNYIVIGTNSSSNSIYQLIPNSNDTNLLNTTIPNNETIQGIFASPFNPIYYVCTNINLYNVNSITGIATILFSNPCVGIVTGNNNNSNNTFYFITTTSVYTYSNGVATMLFNSFVGLNSITYSNTLSKLFVYDFATSTLYSIQIPEGIIINLTDYSYIYGLYFDDLEQYLYASFYDPYYASVSVILQFSLSNYNNPTTYSISNVIFGSITGTRLSSFIIIP